jgi:hypothetical protein
MRRKGDPMAHLALARGAFLATRHVSGAPRACAKIIDRV